MTLSTVMSWTATDLSPQSTTCRVWVGKIEDGEGKNGELFKAAVLAQQVSNVLSAQRFREVQRGLIFALGINIYSSG